MQLPTSYLGTCRVTRLIIGGNPFSGFSHQSAERDRQMRNYYTAGRIKEALAAAEQAGINTFFGRADNHILRLVNEYRNEGGRIQFFAQTAPERADTAANIRQAAEYGAVGCYLHGGQVAEWYEQGQMSQIARLVELIRELQMVAGVAAHDPQVHLEIHAAQVPVDFHAVSFYNLPGRRGQQTAIDEPKRFSDADPDVAVRAIRRIPRTCVGYKVLAAGRRDVESAFRFAFANIKPTDCINVGMFTADDPNMIARDAELAARIIAELSQ